MYSGLVNFDCRDGIEEDGEGGQCRNGLDGQHVDV